MVSVRAARSAIAFQAASARRQRSRTLSSVGRVGVGTGLGGALDGTIVVSHAQLGHSPGHEKGRAPSHAAAVPATLAFDALQVDGLGLAALVLLRGHS